jgi:hypothetical protein
MPYFLMTTCSGCGKQLRISEAPNPEVGFGLAESFRITCEYCGETQSGLLSNLQVTEVAPESFLPDK